ncbi:hypothetical protein OG883_05055 [Streptomyces sp. NBC_01142]|nr:hypothetical protein [Streptomyces sp. NBC_01142]MCX4819282.1 hypothetical protein [Streptomyces sp. NBC_01142]
MACTKCGRRSDRPFGRAVAGRAALGDVHPVTHGATRVSRTAAAEVLVG